MVEEEVPRLLMEEVDVEQQEKEEAKELQATWELLQRYEEEWGSHMTSLREQEIKEARSKIKRIEKKMGSRKRDKEQLKGARRKRLKYNVEEESWGEEQGATEVGSSTPSPPRHSC